MRAPQRPGRAPNPRDPRRQPPQQQVRVGHRRQLAAAPVRGRPGIRSCALGPTRKAPPASRLTIEPPPAPTVCRSTVGNRTGSPATSRSVARPAAPPAIRQTSVEVPPMSSEIALSTPASAATRAAPTTPAAGPRPHASAGWAAASSTESDAAGGAHHERLRQARPRHRRREALPGTARQPAPGTRRSQSSRPARTRGTPAPPRATRRCAAREPPPQLLGDRALVRRVAEREQQADRDRLDVVPELR
mgnify:CR=1 FL=1